MSLLPIEPASNEQFSENYRETVFYAWYEGNRRPSKSLIKSLPANENGKRPSVSTIELWSRHYGWVERADAMDAEISQQFQEKIIDKRVKMYEEHAEIANKLLVKAKAFLETNEISRMDDALKAINLGAELERISVGQADMGRKLLAMSGEQLTKELNKLLGTTDDTIEGVTEEEG